MAESKEGQEDNPVGRPSVYTEDIAIAICDRIAAGESLRDICKDDSIPARSTVQLWINRNHEGFSDRYIKACELRLFWHAEELIDIADDGSNDWMERFDKEGVCIGWQQNGEAVNRSRLRVDTRKWVLSKLVPKYKEKQETTDISEMARLLAGLIANLPD